MLSDSDLFKASNRYLIAEKYSENLPVNAELSFRYPSFSSGLHWGVVSLLKASKGSIDNLPTEKRAIVKEDDFNERGKEN